MDPTIQINQRVSVVALYRDKSEPPELCLPIKMKHGSKEIVFTELGLRHPTSAGKRMIHIFDMSDGSSDYRLEFDAESLTWTLISQIEGIRAPA
jgi:hypothetical protein